LPPAQRGRPGAWKVDGEKVVTYLEAILQENFKSVIIIGSGAIGVEFATVWSSYGVDVTIVEMLRVWCRWKMRKSRKSWKRNSETRHQMPGWEQSGVGRSNEFGREGNGIR